MISAQKRRGRGRTISRPASAKYAARRHVQKHKGVYVAGAVVAGAVGGGLVVRDRTVNVRLYHNTDKKNISSIKKHGLHGVKAGSYSHINFHEPVGHVFVSKGRNSAQTKAFGNHVVRIKMNRKQFNQNAVRDRNIPGTHRAMRIHESHLHGKKIRTYPGGPRQRLSYKMTFPDGTKESYGSRPRKKR